MNTLNSTEQPTSETSSATGGQPSSKSPQPPTTARKTRKRRKKSLGSEGRRVPVPTKHNDHRLRDARTEEARKRLGVTSDQMRGVPRISHLLACADRGIDGCIEALRLSDDADAGRFIERYDRVRASDRKRVSIEEIAVAAGVPVRNLLAATLVAVEYMGTSAARMATASFSAPVIAAVAKRAVSGPSPTANSKLFLAGSGFLPRPANRDPGVFVNITNQNAQDAKRLHEATEAPAPPTLEAAPVVPYLNTEDQLKELHGKLDSDRMLESPKNESMPVTTSGIFKDSEELECIPEGR